MCEAIPGSSDIEQKPNDQDIPQLNQSRVNAIIPVGTDLSPELVMDAFINITQSLSKQREIWYAQWKEKSFY